jgi:coatomer protein complex subunit alpha (xenin)
VCVCDIFTIQFHPKEDLVLSASLDHTVRVWDIGGLTQKTVSIAGNNSSQEGDDFFGASDFNAKHILEVRVCSVCLCVCEYVCV